MGNPGTRQPGLPVTTATAPALYPAGAVIELRYRRAGVDSEVRTRRYPRFRPPDLRGSSARRPRWACHCLAAPHDVRRTVSDAPTTRSCGTRCGATRRDSAGGRRQPKPLVELARLRSIRRVEAAGAIDGDVPGHGTFQLLPRPSDDTPDGLPRIEANGSLFASRAGTITTRTGQRSARSSGRYP